MHAKSCVPNAWLHMCVLCSLLIGMYELRTCISWSVVHKQPFLMNGRKFSAYQNYRRRLQASTSHFSLAATSDWELRLWQGRCVLNFTLSFIWQARNPNHHTMENAFLGQWTALPTQTHPQVVEERGGYIGCNKQFYYSYCLWGVTTIEPF